MIGENIVSFDVPEGDIEAIIAYLSELPALVDMVAARALPRIGNEVLLRIRRDGPRSAVHRGPAKRPRGRSDRWRSAVVHAIDTIKVSAIRRDKLTNKPYVVVGPGRGDNSPSFYLKFHEYGTAGDAYGGKPFIRPAHREVRQDVAADIFLEETNKLLREAKPK